MGRYCSDPRRRAASPSAAVQEPKPHYNHAASDGRIGSNHLPTAHPIPFEDRAANGSVRPQPPRGNSIFRLRTPFSAPRSTPTNAASEAATSTIEELPLHCHMTISAVRERICTHRTFTLGSTDSPGFNNSSELNSSPGGRSKSIRTGMRCTTFT